MPLINGRYYMNPIFGAAVELARNAEADPQFNNEVFRHGTPEGDLKARDAFYR